MKIWKDKSGRWIDRKEFMSRFKDGVVNITPYQQARIVYKNSYLMLFGVLAGLIFTLFSFKNLWWLSIILFSAFINTVVVQIGNYQKYIAFKNIEELTQNE